MKRKPSLFFIFILFSFLLLLKPSPVLAALGFTELGSVVDSNTINNSNFGLGAGTADINGDGYSDLVVTSYAGTTGRLYVFFGGATLNTTADLVISGEAVGDYFGKFASGDFDEDGYDDLVIGAGGNDQMGSNAGKVYFFFGSSSLSGIKAATTADITILGNTTTMKSLGDFFTTGDFNGDGNLDFAVDSPNADSNAGAVYLYFGNGTRSFDTTYDKKLTVSGSFNFGIDSLATGDINGDGYDDVLAADLWFSRSVLYLFYGGASMDTNYDVKITGEATADYLGRHISNAADLNNDGYDDICFGAYANNTAASKAGRAYCFFSSASFSGDKLAANADVIISGAAANDNFGRRLFPYDVNNDGFRDLIIGVYQTNGSQNGYVNIYLGNGTTSFDTTADFTITAADLGESATLFGNYVSAGDLDNDYWPDIFLISMRGGNGTGTAGRVHIFEVNHGTPIFSLNSPFYTTSSTPTLTGTATDTVNLSGVQWSTGSTSTGTWTGCTASDGSFDSTSEGFSCPMTSAISETQSRTIYLRTYDTNSAYMPTTSYRSLTYVYDTTGPSASWANTDGGGRTFSPVQADNLYTTDNLPSFSFTKAADTNAGISKYQILVKPEGKDYYTYLDDIPHHHASGTVLDEASRYVRYTDDDILIHSKKDADQLANGGYKWKVRVLDKAGNQTDTSEKILLINTHQANFSNTWFPLVLLSTKPSFYGITTVDTKVALTLKQNDQIIFTKTTTANPESRFGINIDKSDNLQPGTYTALLSALNLQGDYIQTPEFKYTYGAKTSSTVAGAKTSQPTPMPIPTEVESAPEPTPSTSLRASPTPKPRRCFLFWCW